MHPSDFTSPATPAPDPGQFAAAAHLPAPASDDFHIVALGGSAGSLDALQRFFQHLPAQPGLAFVVVLHLMPTQDGELSEVLRHFTAMPVLEATNNLRVQPNHVYVIPPAFELGIWQERLQLLPPTRPPARRMPIDHFLESLANDVRERAVCLLFSGMGTDGSVGLKLVMENFGMVMVQDPATATFDALPRAALATGFVDFALAPELMPARLLDYVEHPLHQYAAPDVDPDGVDEPAHALAQIFALIRSRTGHDFSQYKRNTLFRRIERRMNAHQLRTLPRYVRYLRQTPHEVELLFRELLIGVTKFFRDAEAFERLRQHLRPLLLRKPAESTVRIWAPGCSTGEEAYSLAITLLELFDELEPERRLRLQVFATDISSDSIDFARRGLYSANIEADISSAQLERFFQRQQNGYQIRHEVRDTVVFALHNLARDAPFTRLDMLCCRNLLIYLSAELQKSLLPVFHYALNAGGLLFLGPSENISSFQDLFQTLDVKWKLSCRTDTLSSLMQLAQFPSALGRSLSLPSSSSSALMATPLPLHREANTFASLVQRELLRSYAPPAVVINHKGEILYVNGRTGKYLEPAPGLSGMNLFEMAREQLNVEISGAVHRAIQSHDDVVVDEVLMQTDGGLQRLRLRVKYLLDPELLANLLVVSFEEQPLLRRSRRVKNALLSPELEATTTALNRELQFTKLRLQTTIEEMETSLEELKSTNEELQSANEELQSSNEEAMTNKEEMQSLNEELMTLNAQHLAKTDELSQAANDMKNLLDATEIAIVFLDNNMVIKRFTPSVARIVNLVPADVGRPFTHFASNLRYEHLLRDVQLVLDRLTPLEVAIQVVSGQWYTMRILPYRTLDNYISGAVITFTESNDRDSLEARHQARLRLLESQQVAVQQPLLTLDEQLLVHASNPAAQVLLGLPAAGQPAYPLASLGAPWSQPALRDALTQLLADNSPGFDNLPLDAELPGQGHRRLRLYGRRLLHQGQPTGYLLLGVQAVEA